MRPVSKRLMEKFQGFYQTTSNLKRFETYLKICPRIRIDNTKGILATAIISLIALSIDRINFTLNGSIQDPFRSSFIGKYLKGIF